MQLFHLRLIVCLWSQVKSTIKVCAIVYCAVFTNLWCDAFKYICIYINRRPRIVYQQSLRFIQNRLAIQNLASMQLAHKCAFPVNEIWTTQLNANSYVCMWYHCQLKRRVAHRMYIDRGPMIRKLHLAQTMRELITFWWCSVWLMIGVDS